MIFSRDWLLKHYFARRDGETRFYPFGVLGRGWVIEESQAPSLERCVAVYSYGAFLFVVPIVLLQNGHRFIGYRELWIAVLLFCALYRISVGYFARGRDGHIRRAPQAVLLRDMALNQSPERLRWRIGAGIVVVAMGVIGLLGMIGRSPLGALGLGAGTLFFGFVLLKLIRVYRVQKQLGPHAETKAVFD